MMVAIEHVIRQVLKMKQMKENERRDAKKAMMRAKEDRKMPTDFECFVCGTIFMTNEEWKYHLKGSTHGHLYDTISPQEQEEVRSPDNR